MDNFWNYILKICEIAGIVIQYTIALVLLLIAIFGGSISIKINGIERFFR